MFSEKFDTFMWFYFTSLMKYIYDGFFIKNVKEIVGNSEIFINIFCEGGNSEFLW